jgi:signal transduction histidine kinase
MTSPKNLKFKPYARLLTMLGDQLIKNERIALVEIIKNSYDADASWVKVTFEGFDSNMGQTATSKIIIEDDGTGMTRDIIENHWVNPATPTKLISKLTKPTTRSGRVIQGEKGIGRFALLKLGKKISVLTRPQKSESEFILSLDLSLYDGDFIQKGKPLFLNELSAKLIERNPATAIIRQRMPLGLRTIQRKPMGTRIEISHLSSTWSMDKITQIFNDMARLQSLFFTEDTDKAPKVPDFELAIYQDDNFLPLSDDYREELARVVKNSAVMKIENGRYDESNKTFTFDLDGSSREFALDNPELTGLKVYRDYKKAMGYDPFENGTHCGPFSFAFYVFDFNADEKSSFHLDRLEKDLIKEHRIYLYRDGIRVFPYGDPDDDWLQIDVYRGTVKASGFLSNDQVVGYINITQEDNPSLRDKTSREGLIDAGAPNGDFIWLLQLILSWIRANPYTRYRVSLNSGKELEVFKKELVQNALDGAVAAAANDSEVRDKISEASRLYQAERHYLIQRAESTEHLAGVGLSVETASHDLMMALAKALTEIDSLVSQTQRPGELDKVAVNRTLTMLRGILSFVQTQMRDVQLLFKSSKQRRKDVRVEEILIKVQRLFQTALDRAKIEVTVETVGSPLVAKTTDAVVLQLLLNLFDNSLYWLQSAGYPRRIQIELNGDEGTLIFSDNGPGIKSEDAAYIFEPFFTGKGEDGRGLGLYIARQLLERHEYSIQLADLKSHKRQSGANFLVSFVKEE